MIKNKQKLKTTAYKTPRNEFHFYLQRATAGQAYVAKNKKKIINRKRKYKSYE